MLLRASSKDLAMPMARELSQRPHPPNALRSFKPKLLPGTLFPYSFKGYTYYIGGTYY